MTNIRTKQLSLAACMTAILIILGSIPGIPIGLIPVPIVLQNLGIFIIGELLDTKEATLSVILFMTMVALGLPVLSGGRGGLAVFIGPTCGYLLSWLFVPAGITKVLNVCGARKFWWREVIVVIIVGVLFADFMGSIGLVLSSGLSLKASILSNVIFLPGDLLKVGLSVLLARRIRKII